MPDPNPTPAPTPTPEEQLRALYDTGDMGFDPEDFGVNPAPAPKPAPARQTPPPPPVEPPAPAKHQHNRAMVRLALDLGWTQAEIDATPADEFDAAVYWAQRQHMADARDLLRQSIHHAPAPRPEETPKPAEDRIEFDGEIEDVDENGQIVRRRVTEEDYDRSTPGLMKYLKDQKKELAEAKAAIKEFREADTRRRAAERTAAIDAIFDTLAAPLKKLLGTGPVSANPKSLEFRRRVLVLGASGCDLDNDPLETLRAKITRGAAEIFGVSAAAEPEGEPGVYPEVEPTPLPVAPKPAPPRAANGQYRSPEDEEVERRKRDFEQAPLGRPSGRQGSELPPGEKKAMATWKRGADALFGSEDDLDSKAGY